VPHEDSKDHRDSRPRRWPCRLRRGGPCFKWFVVFEGCRNRSRAHVGFNWHNGSFETVTVTFPQLYAGKPLEELARTVREVVARDFKRTPDTIVLAFTLKG
jgi:hypothetical protein